MSADAAKRHAVARGLEKISTRELYHCGGLLSTWPTTIVGGHVRFAMRGFKSTPKVPLREALENCLVDGWVLFRKVSANDQTPKPEDPNIVERTEWTDGDLTGVWIEYEYEAYPGGAAVGQSERDASRHREQPVRWERCEHVYVSKLTGEFIRETRDYPEGSESNFRQYPWKSEKLEFFPYAGVRWVENRSLLEPVKATILHYEAVMWDIAQENQRHSQRQKVYQGVSKPESDSLTGKEQIPRDANIFYPDTHPDGIRPMFEELDRLEGFIRDNTGSIKVADLHNASGASRLIEVTPNITQAEALREVSFKIMDAIAPPGYELHFTPLVQYSPAELQIMDALYRQWALDNIISADEWLNRVRFLGGFSGKPQGRPVLTIAEQAPAA